MSDQFDELRDLLLDVRATLTADIADLRGEFGEMRGEFGQVRGEMTDLRGDVGQLQTGLDTASGRIDDLRTTLLEFRTSVSHELQATNRRFDNMADEVRDRITTSETAILNTIRDLSRESTRRLSWMEERVADVERRVDERPA